MGHVEVDGLTYVLPDGRLLLHEVSFRVGEGVTAGLVGPNGAGKTTLLGLIAGDLAPAAGRVARSGGLGVMRQFIGAVRDGRTVHDLLLSVAPERLRGAAAALRAAEAALAARDDEPAQLAYAHALAEYGDAGGYAMEVVWDTCATEAMGLPYDAIRERPVVTLSGGEQKRLVLEALLRGPDEVLLLDEPDNYLDVPAKRRLEEALRATAKTVLLVSHDRQLLATAADRIVTVESRGAWVHGGGFATYAQARRDRVARLEERRRRWDEERAKLARLVQTLRQTAANNDALSSAYRAARTRLERFEQAGPPEQAPREQNVRMRLRGGRTGKRVIVCEGLAITGLTRPFDTEIWYGERVAILGANGSGKSHFLRLLTEATGEAPPTAAAPTPQGPALPEELVLHEELAPHGELALRQGLVLHEELARHKGRVRYEGLVRLGARVVPGHFAQTHLRPDLHGRTPADLITERHGLTLNEAMAALARYELAPAGRQRFETLSGGQQARLQILLLELQGATLLLLDEPTDNLDLASADALQRGLEGFSGTVLAVTHDRWFATDFDRYLIFHPNGTVHESPQPTWD
ncbi:ABC transporter ATP-binding protein [Sphaerisporangium siamense]|uniref:ATPase subunit of ABC transporter with duplicated ATPase domains n=1 Tax=Sphaerisporangium siamense TaxID=795645 RepID=A0A7W7GB21_9ACTN|nr:ATP-binding cassette domain-containing protein [Sphaerisporangium siamense]MBB4704618.1 ATPase subunit of ABC transporter with duplicated ATPase domains [Sphaerisporangium siamense]GII86232.1 ABC transporter ATP-binding protein [Sphaerisporangium siamense]